jgi:hypothetical protein
MNKNLRVFALQGAQDKSFPFFNLRAKFLLFELLTLINRSLLLGSILCHRRFPHVLSSNDSPTPTLQNLLLFYK